jgi:dethiobiotin synthetase
MGGVKRTIFITGTDTGVGKTVLTALLAEHFRAQGVSVAALKPVCSGGRGDARILHAALDGTLTLDAINPWHFRAPIAPILAARREKRVLRLAPVLAHIRSVQKRFAVTLVEGAGGVLSPLGEDFNSRDLIRALGAVPVIVAPNRLGVVNHVLMTIEALPKQARARARVVLMMALERDAATASNQGLLEHYTGRRLWPVPRLGRAFRWRQAIQASSVGRKVADLAAAILEVPGPAGK